MYSGRQRGKKSETSKRTNERRQLLGLFVVICRFLLPSVWKCVRLSFLYDYMCAVLVYFGFILCSSSFFYLFLIRAAAAVAVDFGSAVTCFMWMGFVIRSVLNVVSARAKCVKNPKVHFRKSPVKIQTVFTVTNILQPPRHPAPHTTNESKTPKERRRERAGRGKSEQ